MQPLSHLGLGRSATITTNMKASGRTKVTVVRQALMVSIGILFTLICLGYGARLDWEGNYEQPTYKTLWDWLDFLIVPAIIAAGGLWFNR
jgi:hypothetical protein